VEEGAARPVGAVPTGDEDGNRTELFRYLAGIDRLIAMGVLLDSNLA